MAFKHSKSTVIIFNGVDVSDPSAGFGITDSTCEVSMKTEDNTTYGKNSEVYGPALYSGSFSMGGKYVVGATGPSAVLMPLVIAGTLVPVDYRPEGTGSTLPRRRFSVIVTKFTETAPVAGYRLWAAEFQPSDDWDLTAQ